jgi:hypothetical protein
MLSVHRVFPGTDNVRPALMPQVGLTVGTMDANSGAPWSKMDVSDLRNEIAHDRTVAQTASFLCRGEDEVREKMKELALTEHPGKRVRVVR